MTATFEGRHHAVGIELEVGGLELVAGQESNGFPLWQSPPAIPKKAARYRFVNPPVTMNQANFAGEASQALSR
jgi:hypothetical protein